MSNNSYNEENEDIEIITGSLGQGFLDSEEANLFDFEECNVSEIQERSLEKDIVKIKKTKAIAQENGFNFEPRCRCCNLALEDPEIHNIWLSSKQKATQVQKYIKEKHNIQLHFDSISKHMKEHFMPVYDEFSYQRRENLLNLKKFSKERQEAIYLNKIDSAEEMIMQKIENIYIRSNRDQPLEVEMMALKTITAAAAALVKIQEHKLNIIGQNKSPEEMQKIMQEYVKGLLYKVLEKAPDEDTKKAWTIMFQNLMKGGA
jgi:hypothetical protein